MIPHLSLTPLRRSVVHAVLTSSLLAARGHRRVGEGDCAPGRPGEVDGPGRGGMGPWTARPAPQGGGAEGAGAQRAAGGPAPLPGEHPDQRPQLQGHPAGEGAAR